MIMEEVGLSFNRIGKPASFFIIERVFGFPLNSPKMPLWEMFFFFGEKASYYMVA
jgi:hypothetical protein